MGQPGAECENHRGTQLAGPLRVTAQRRSTAATVAEKRSATASTNWTNAPPVLRAGGTAGTIFLQSAQNSGLGPRLRPVSLKQPGAMSLNVKVLPDEQLPVTGAEIVNVDPLRVRRPSRTTSAWGCPPLVCPLRNRQALGHRIHPSPDSRVPRDCRVLYVHILRVFLQPRGHCPTGWGHPESSGDSGWPLGVRKPLFPLRRTTPRGQNLAAKIQGTTGRRARIVQPTIGNPAVHQGLEVQLRVRIGNTCIANTVRRYPKEAP